MAQIWIIRDGQIGPAWDNCPSLLSLKLAIFMWDFFPQFFIRVAGEAAG
jgi:hypothetical protein